MRVNEIEEKIVRAYIDTKEKNRLHENQMRKYRTHKIIKRSVYGNFCTKNLFLSAEEEIPPSFSFPPYFFFRSLSTTIYRADKES